MLNAVGFAVEELVNRELAIHGLAVGMMLLIELPKVKPLFSTGEPRPALMAAEHTTCFVNESLSVHGLNLNRFRTQTPN